MNQLHGTRNYLFLQKELAQKLSSVLIAFPLTGG